MSEKIPETVQGWKAKRRAALVLEILKGQTSVAEAKRKHGLTVAGIEGWKDKFLLGAENALSARPKGVGAAKNQEIKRLKQKGGELVLDKDILKAAMKGRSPKNVRGVIACVPRVSARRVCRVYKLCVTFWAIHRSASDASRHSTNPISEHTQWSCSFYI